MTWLVWSLLSAFFAGITAILAKVGVANVNSHLATAIRTTVILLFTWAIAYFAAAQRRPGGHWPAHAALHLSEIEISGLKNWWRVGAPECRNGYPDIFRLSPRGMRRPRLLDQCWGFAA